MIVSTASMFIGRIGGAYLICALTDFGMFGTWLAMFIDWAAKAVIFTVHYLRGKWTSFRPI